MIDPRDETCVLQAVGTATFDRGLAYARNGAVTAYAWSDDDGRVLLTGTVEGTGSRPYRTRVGVRRSPPGGLTTFMGSCTCPVGNDCKHAVALFLTAEADHDLEDTEDVNGTEPRGRIVDLDARQAERRTTGSTRSTLSTGGPPSWERSLDTLLAGDQPEEGAGLGDGTPWWSVVPDALGLQFDLTSAPAGRRATGAHRPSIVLRPVIPGRTGNWVRTGVSWSSLTYLAAGQVAASTLDDQLRVLRELQAISRLAGNRRSFLGADEVVRLEDIASRRLWDLLSEARELGIALVQSGRPSRPVELCSHPAAVTADVTRDGSDVQLRLRLEADGQPVAPESSLLLGRPAHGVAWWGGASPSTSSRGTATTAAGQPLLHLAPVATPMDDHLRALLATTIDVPHRDEERFVGQFVPALRRRVDVGSSDGSVDLPSVTSPLLVLLVEHRADHRLALTWGRGAASRGSPVGSRDPWAGHWSRLHPADRAAVEAVTSIAAPMPELFEPTPWGERLAPRVELQGMATARFVTELLPQLAQVAGVEVRRSGTASEYHESETVPVVHLGGAPSGTGDWFDLAVTVTVDGEDVPFVDLFVALAEGRSHLLLPSGTYFALDREELRHLARLIAEARMLRDTPGGGIPVSRFQASLWDELQHLGVLTAQAEAWSASARALVDAADRVDHPPPASLHATLRPYQQTGFNWLAYLFEHQLGGILADDMGLGKTLQALAVMCRTGEQGTVDHPYLVVAPTSVVQNWMAECRRFAPDLRPAAVTATVARRRVPLPALAEQAGVVITSYSLFRLEYEDYAAVPWAGAFFDEAQFLKNRASQSYQRAKLLPVACKVAMTGTPMENDLMELWSLLSLTAPGLFPDAARFSEHYRVPIERNGDAERLALLRRRLRPLMLRRTKEQVATDLPDKQQQTLEVELSPKHKRIYQTYLQRERQKILGLLDDPGNHRLEILRSLTLLRQASLDASLVDDAHTAVPSTKLDTLQGMLAEIVEDGHRVLVFSQFTRFLARARQRLDAAGIEHCYLDGRTRDREAVIARFRDGRAPAFLISLKAGGFGLNLTEADYCILLDPWWNPAVEAQAVDRAHRIGQTRKVMVYRFVAKDTIEEKVVALQQRKAALFANVVDGGGFESGALTAEDIRNLVS